MSLKQNIKTAMTDAMKAKNAARLQSIRLIWNSIRKTEIDTKKEDLSDDEIAKLLQKMAKQTQESLDQAEQVGRAELADEAKAELEVFQEFLPEQMGEAEIEKTIVSIVEELKASGELPEGGRAMGAVMQKAMAAIGSKADGKAVQVHVRKALGL